MTTMPTKAPATIPTTVPAPGPLLVPADAAACEALDTDEGPTVTMLVTKEVDREVGVLIVDKLVEVAVVEVVEETCNVLETTTTVVEDTVGRSSVGEPRVGVVTMGEDVLGELTVACVWLVPGVGVVPPAPPVRSIPQ